MVTNVSDMITEFDKERLRSYSSAFSRNTIRDILQYDDFRHIDWIFKRYDHDMSSEISYGEYFKYMYNVLLEHYRCEYVYKTLLLDKLICELKKLHSATQSVVFNEFKVGDSIVDIAFFNGESKAYEIKTDFDSPKRLNKQIDEYRKIFDKCYIVIPQEKYETYLDIVEPEVGLVLLAKRGKKISLKEVRHAKINSHIDPDIVIRCLHTDEYKSIIINRFGSLPDVPEYIMFDTCRELLYAIPEKELKKDFREIIKLRKANILSLATIPVELRQLSLALGLTHKVICQLVMRLEKHIN